jgi:IMP and pyridine-specific 5'-nucleotidase
MTGKFDPQRCDTTFVCRRHILNMAQIHASAEDLRLITFDADGTLYADGTHMEQDNLMIDMMIALLQRHIFVAIVTAAGYPGEPRLFEARIRGLLDAFKERNLPSHVTDRFLMLGGECNYLLRCAAIILPLAQTSAARPSSRRTVACC